MGPSERRRPAGAAVLRPQLTDAALRTTVEVLGAVGYERLSMDEVARRAGVGKAALYRRWPSKVDMVVDALAQLSPPPQHVEAASLVEAVEELVREVVAWLGDERVRVVLPDVVAAAGRHPPVARALSEHVAGPRRRWADGVLRCWTTDDDAGRASREMAVDLLAAPLYWRITQQLPVDENYLTRLGELVTRELRGS